MKQSRMDYEHSTLLHIHGVTIEPAKWQVSIEEQTISLTSQQFRILHLLMRNAGRFFTREQILENVHGPGRKVSGHLVDSQIFVIRKKLGNHKHLIQTKRGIGYGIRL